MRSILMLRLLCFGCMLALVMGCGQDGFRIPPNILKVMDETYRGPAGEPGKDGKRGKQGRDGIDGRDGVILVLKIPYLILETQTETFAVQITAGTQEQSYVTPVAEVSVPQGGGEVVVTPSDPETPVSVTPAKHPPVQDDTIQDDTIWHVIETPDGFKIYRRPETLDELEDLLGTFDNRWFGHTEYQGDAEFIAEYTGLTNLTHLREVAK